MIKIAIAVQYKVQVLSSQTIKLKEKMAEKLRKAFASWIDNGHNNFDDENTIILKIDLLDCVLFSHGTRYEINFR